MTPEQKKALHRALMNAFPNPDDLELVVQYAFGKTLAQFGVAGGTYPAQVMNLIGLVEHDSRLGAFLAQATNTRPDNLDLQSFVVEWERVPRTAQGEPNEDPPELPLPAPLVPELFDSLESLRRAADRYRDKSFVAKRLFRRVDVRPPDAWLTYEETLRNVSKSDCTEILRIIASDSPTDFSRLNYSAQLELPDEAEPIRAGVRYQTLHKGRLFVVTLGFKGGVVANGEILKLRVQCVLPSAVARNDDYFVFPFLFGHPAPETVFEVAFQEEPADVHLYFVQERGAASESFRPVRLPRPTSATGTDGTPVVVYSVKLFDTSDTHLFTWSLTADSDSR